MEQFIVQSVGHFGVSSHLSFVHKKLDSSLLRLVRANSSRTYIKAQYEDKIEPLTS